MTSPVADQTHVPSLALSVPPIQNPNNCERSRWKIVHYICQSMCAKWTLFSTSNSFYQMCYCCRKLDFQTFSGKFEIGLKCTAVWLANSVCQPIRQLYIWGRFQIWASNIQNPYIWGRFNSFSHVICLSQSDSCTFEAESDRSDVS